MAGNDGLAPDAAQTIGKFAFRQRSDGFEFEARDEPVQQVLEPSIGTRQWIKVRAIQCGHWIFSSVKADSLRLPMKKILQRASPAAQSTITPKK
jgi:hypothetical protein